MRRTRVRSTLTRVVDDETGDRLAHIAALQAHLLEVDREARQPDRALERVAGRDVQAAAVIGS